MKGLPYLFKNSCILNFLSDGFLNAIVRTQNRQVPVKEKSDQCAHCLS